MEQPDHDSCSYRNHSARQSDFSVMEAKQSHSVIDSQDQTSRPQTPPSGLTEVRTQDVTPSQKLTVNRNQEAETNDGTTQSKQRRCKCKASRCLKLFCECFASGSYCIGCNCLHCHNTLEKETERQEAIKAALERNPDAFMPKIAGKPSWYQ